MPKQQQHPTVFGPLETTLRELRGLRLWTDEHGAGGSGGDGGSEGGDGGNDDGQQSAGNGSGGDSGQQQGNGDRSSSSGSSSRNGGRQGGSNEQTFSREYVTELRNENATRRKNETTLTSRAEGAERERDEARSRVAELERRDAIRDAAGEAGGNPAVLLDSSAFGRATKDLDLSDRTKVVDAIKAFVKDNPHTSAAPSGPGSSGSGRPGGSTSETVDNSNSLTGAVGAALAGQGVQR